VKNKGIGQPYNILCKKNKNRWMYTMDKKIKLFIQVKGRKYNKPHGICKTRIEFKVDSLKKCPHV